MATARKTATLAPALAGQLPEIARRVLGQGQDRTATPWQGGPLGAVFALITAQTAANVYTVGLYRSPRAETETELGEALAENVAAIDQGTLPPLKIGTWHTVLGRYQTAGGEWRVLIGFPARWQLFPINLAQDGGSAGSASAQASFTYTVTDLQGNELATEAAPAWARPVGLTLAATKGTAYYDGAGALVLFQTDERPDTATCPSEP